MAEIQSTVTLNWTAPCVQALSPCGGAAISLSSTNTYDFTANVASTGATTYALSVEKTDGTAFYGSTFFAVADIPDGEYTFQRTLQLEAGEYQWAITALDENNSTVLRSEACVFTVLEAETGECGGFYPVVTLGETATFKLEDLVDYDGSVTLVESTFSGDIAEWSLTDGVVSIVGVEVGTQTGTYELLLDTGIIFECTFTLEVLPDGLADCGDVCAVTDWETPVVVYPMENSSLQGVLLINDNTGSGTFFNFGDGSITWAPDSDSVGFVGVVETTYTINKEVENEYIQQCCGTIKILVVPPANTLSTEFCAVFVEGSLCGDNWQRIGNVTAISHASDTPINTYSDLLTHESMSHTSGITSRTFDITVNYDALAPAQSMLAVKSGFYIRVWMVHENDASETRPMFSAYVLPSNYGWDRQGSGKQKFSISISLTVSGAINTSHGWS